MSFDDRDQTATAYGAVPPARRKRHTTRNVLLTFLALVLVAALIVGFYVWNLGRTFDDRKQTMESAFPEESTRPAVDSAQDRGTNVLLLGADERPEGQEDAGVEGERADSIMLVHVPEDGGEVYVMSIMRDTWVEIPGVGEAKVNQALDIGGMPLMVRTVEELFGLRVDQVASVDFAGFQGLTDALGGVTIDVPQDFVSHDGVAFEQGPQLMDGETALEFVRERYAFADGDYQRVANQRAYVKAVMDKTLNRETLTNPARIQDVVTQFSPYLEVSDGLDAGWIAGVTPDLVGVSSENIQMFTVPNQGVGYSADGQSIVVADYTAMEEIGEAISGDTLSEYVANLNPADQ
ncbi:LCP family protein [Kocuria dechangensis]|nr:LCP family protein [Kocuria dechangensis]